MLRYQCCGGSAKNQCETSGGLDLFLNEKGGKNQIECWLESHKGIFNLDISNVNSCDDIAKKWGCGDEWTVLKKDSFHTPWITRANLLKCIQGKLNEDAENGDLAIRGVWIEGMHRGLALFNQALGAEYNEGTGMSVPGSMSAEYFEKGLQNLYMKSNKTMKEKGSGFTPLDILESSLKGGVAGALGEVCTIRVIYGVSEEEFNQYKLDVSEVEEKCRNWSEKVSRGKTNTATKPETSSMAESLKVFKSLAKSSNTRRNPNASVSYGRESVNPIQNPIPPKADSQWPVCAALNLEELMKAIEDPTLNNMSILQSKLATKNEDEQGRVAKPPNFLTWKNMAVDTKMTKEVKKGKRSKNPGKPENFPLDAAEANSFIIIPLIAPPLLRSWYRMSRRCWEVDKDKKSNVLRACRAVLGTQNWTSYTHNAGADVSDWAKDEYHMYKKSLCSSDMRAMTAMCMVRDMVNACLCNDVENYTLLDDLIDTFENAHEELNGYCERELVWVLGE